MKQLVVYLILVIAFCAQLTALCLAATLAWGGLPLRHASGKWIETAYVFCSKEQITAGRCERTRHSDEFSGPVGWTDSPLLFSTIASLLLLLPWSKAALEIALRSNYPREVSLYAAAGGCLLLCAAYQIMLSQGGARQLGYMEYYGYQNVKERHATLNAITWCRSVELPLFAARHASH